MRAAREEMFTIAPPLPPRRVDMRRTASRAHKNAPVTFTAMTCRRVLALTDSTRENPPVIAALLTKGCDRSKFALSGLKKPDYIFLVGNVSLKGVSAPAGRSDLFDDRPRLCLAGCEIDRHGVAALPGQTSDGRSDASTRASYGERAAFFRMGH